MFDKKDLSPYAARGMSTGIAAGVRAVTDHFGLAHDDVASVFVNAMAKAQAEYVGASQEDMEEQMLKASIASGYFPKTADELE